MLGEPGILGRSSRDLPGEIQLGGGWLPCFFHFFLGTLGSRCGALRGHWGPELPTCFDQAQWEAPGKSQKEGQESQGEVKGLDPLALWRSPGLPALVEALWPLVGTLWRPRNLLWLAVPPTVLHKQWSPRSPPPLHGLPTWGQFPGPPPNRGKAD